MFMVPIYVLKSYESTITSLIETADLKALSVTLRLFHVQTTKALQSLIMSSE